MAVEERAGFGSCPCSGTYEQRWVEVRLGAPGPRQTVLARVSQGACPSCGSRVYKRHVLAYIEACRSPDPRAPAGEVTEG